MSFLVLVGIVTILVFLVCIAPKAVTANQLVKITDPTKRKSYPAVAAVRHYEHTLAFLTTGGYATNVTGSGANSFAGLVVKEVDNSSGASGDLNVEVFFDNITAILTGSGFTQADVGKKVYATDNFTIGVADVANAVPIGTCVGYVSTTQLDVLLSVEFGSGSTQAVNPAADSGVGSTIKNNVTKVAVGAVTTDANDWIVLPAIASHPIGHQIRISCNAGANFELRTPATSNTKINDVDADGTQEYLCTDTDMVIVTKHTTTSWIAQSLTKLGAVRTAVVPD